MSNRASSPFKKRLKQVGWLLLGLFLAFIGREVYVLSQPPNSIILGCMFGKYPKEVIAEGPFVIDENWQSFPIKKQPKRVPTLDDFRVVLSTKSYDHLWDTPPMVPKSFLVGSTIANKGTKDPIYVFMRLYDDLGVGVMLSSNAFNWFPNNEFPEYLLGFGIGHDEWPYYFFSKDQKFSRIEVKATAPITVERIVWSADGLCKWPDRTWDDIAEEKIYRFDRPSPATEELENQYLRKPPKLYD